MVCTTHKTGDYGDGLLLLYQHHYLDCGQHMEIDSQMPWCTIGEISLSIAEDQGHLLQDAQQIRKVVSVKLHDSLHAQYFIL